MLLVINFENNWLITKILIILMMGSLMCDCEQHFLREPLDQQAILGSEVTLPCRVANKKGVLQWTRDDFGLGSERQLPGFTRYTMTGSDDEGDFTLSISPVTLEDDARFQCQVGAARNATPIRSNFARLHVLVPTDNPVILVDDNEDDVHNPLVVEAGSKVKLGCRSKGGKPAPEMLWLESTNGSAHSLASAHTTTTTRLMADGKRFVATSTLEFVAASDDNDRQIVCQAQNAADRQPKQTRIRLRVLYRPIIRIEQAPLRIRASQPQVRFACKFSANPEINRESFRWFLDGDERHEARGSDFMILRNVDKRFHGKNVRCSVKNEIATGSAQITLNVTYGPYISEAPKAVSGVYGQRSSMSCLADSNPSRDLQYRWFALSRPTQTLSTGSNLSLVLISDDIYVCEVSSAYFGEVVSVRAAGRLRAPPTFDVRLTQFAPIGQTASLVCRAHVLPEASDVQWRIGDELIDDEMYPAYHGDIKQMLYKEKLVNKEIEENRKYSIETRVFDNLGLVESRLWIQSVDKEDFTKYVCTMSNEEGTSEVVIELREQATLPVLILALGILGGLILTSTLLLILVLCRRNLVVRRKIVKSKTSSSSTSSTTDTGADTLAPHPLAPVPHPLAPVPHPLAPTHCDDLRSEFSELANLQRPRPPLYHCNLLMGENGAKMCENGAKICENGAKICENGAKMCETQHFGCYSPTRSEQMRQPLYSNTLDTYSVYVNGVNSNAHQGIVVANSLDSSNSSHDSSISKLMANSTNSALATHV